MYHLQNFNSYSINEIVDEDQRIRIERNIKVMDPLYDLLRSNELFKFQKLVLPGNGEYEKYHNFLQRVADSARRRFKIETDNLYAIANPFQVVDAPTPSQLPEKFDSIVIVDDSAKNLYLEYFQHKYSNFKFLQADVVICQSCYASGRYIVNPEINFLTGPKESLNILQYLPKHLETFTDEDIAYYLEQDPNTLKGVNTFLGDNE